MDIVTMIAILVLAAFVGFEVISKIPNTLHTPLMSGTNAIHGIVLVGAILAMAVAEGDALGKVLAVIAVASAMKPPRITIPWIAFVPDISGVCSVFGTFEITSKPTKHASTKMVSSVSRSMGTSGGAAES